MAELKSEEGELRFTLHITRAATGVTEIHEMVGHIVPSPETTQSEGEVYGVNT